jgi:hypothetical protein
MKQVYRVLAYLVALEVMVQASVMVWGIAGLGIWVDDGGVLDKQTFEDAFDNGDTPFDEFTGLMIHGMNGMMIIPAIALLLVIVSFFAKVPQGIAYAFGVLGLIVLQVFLGLFGHEVSALGALHGLNAFILFSVAILAGVRAGRAIKADKVAVREHVAV